MTNWILPASVTLVCWGVWSFIPKITTRFISPISAIIYETLGMGMVGLIALTLVRFQPEFHIKGTCLAILTGFLGLAGGLGFLFAVKSGKVSVVAMFVSMSPLITIGLSYFILGEPITAKEMLGIICAFLAIFLFAS